MQGKTVNQVVASNARKAMDDRDWSYDEVARRLTDAGLPQSRQNVHKKFRSETGRESAFTANELLALSQVFDRPLVWFLLPQPHQKFIGAGEEASGHSVTGYLDRLFADPHGDVAKRLNELGASDTMAEWRALRDHLLAAELDDLLTVEETLRGLADRFSQAGHAVHTKLARAYAEQPQGLPAHPEVPDAEYPPSPAKAAELRKQHIANLKAELRQYEKEEK